MRRFYLSILFALLLMCGCQSSEVEDLKLDVEELNRKINVLSSQIDELEYERDELQDRVEQLERNIEDARDELESYSEIFIFGEYWYPFDGVENALYYLDT